VQTDVGEVDEKVSESLSPKNCNTELELFSDDNGLESSASDKRRDVFIKFDANLPGHTCFAALDLSPQVEVISVVYAQSSAENAILLSQSCSNDTSVFSITEDDPMTTTGSFESFFEAHPECFLPIAINGAFMKMPGTKM
jgi:hypothetical protein